MTYTTRRILVTGSADGLGRAAAQALLSAGHEVVVHARNRKRAADIGPLLEQGAGIVVGDFADRDAVRRIAAELNAAQPLHAVIHNAGVWSGPAVMPVNIIAPYLLTALLPAPRRLVYLSSGSHFGGHPHSSLAGIDWRGEPQALTSGGYWYHRQRQEPHEAVHDHVFQDRLLHALAHETGVPL
ncbi:SDR family NAD(P)-dependent oxidoreductase [Streptomyces sp. NPDC059385]|uniref:SDR family NAD(P)-dependent oxidoreductase n=1 Tax=Streptomyces sp. NPDC059385 TaxID=3346817 RepID=UPI00367540BF